MKTNRKHCWTAGVAAGALLLSATAAFAAPPAARAGRSARAGANVEASATKPNAEPAVDQAGLAARLALQGQKTRSPILLLAAAELLGNLRESPRDTDDVKTTVQGDGAAGGSDKQAPRPLSVARLVELARQYAEDDPQLQKLIDSRIENLSRSGIIARQGAGKPSVEMFGTTFKIIKEGVLSPGYRNTLSNVIFERGPAIVLVVGDGDGDLDLEVYDEDSGRLIGRDDDLTSQCIVAWRTRWEGPFKIRVSNVGRIAERYMVLVNW